MDEKDLGDISFDRREESPLEDSEVGNDLENRIETNLKRDFNPANSMDTELNNICPYDNTAKPTQKETAPDDEDPKDNSNYNDPNKDVSNDHDAQDSTNYQDNQDNSDDQDGSCSSDENSNQDTSCSDNFSNNEGEFQTAGDNEMDSTDRDDHGLHNQHSHPYERDLATFPDDQAVDYSAAFPSNRLTNKSSIVANVIMPKIESTALSDDVSTENPCQQEKSFDFPGFSACLSERAEQQCASPTALSSNVSTGNMNVPETSSDDKSNLQQQENDSNLYKSTSAKESVDRTERSESTPPPSDHDASSVPASNDSSPSVRRNSDDLSAQNLEASSEISGAMDVEPIPPPVEQYAFRQLRSRSVALALKPQPAKGRRRTIGNKIPLDQDRQCQSLPPVSFSSATTSSSAVTSIPVNFSSKDLGPRSVSPSCFSLPAGPQEYSYGGVPSHQVNTTTAVVVSTTTVVSTAETSNISQDSSKQSRNEQSNSLDAVSTLPAHLIPPVSDVSACSTLPVVLKSSSNGTTTVATAVPATTYANLPVQEQSPCQHHSGTLSKPESSFGRDILNIPQDDESRCESSETTDDSSFPKRKKYVKVKAIKKRICRYFTDSTDDEDGQATVKPSTSVEAIADEGQLNSSYSANQTSTNTVPCIQQNVANNNVFSESSSSEMEMQVDTGAESEADVEPSTLVASGTRKIVSNASTDSSNNATELSTGNLVPEQQSNVVNDDSLPVVESEITVESSSIEGDKTVTRTIPLGSEWRPSHASATEESSELPDINSQSLSNLQCKSVPESEGKQSRRRFKKTKTRLERREESQLGTANEPSESTVLSASNNVPGSFPPRTRCSHTSPLSQDDSTRDQLPDIVGTSQPDPSSPRQEHFDENSPIAVEGEPTAAISTGDPLRSPSSSSSRQELAAPIPNSNHILQQQMQKDILLWRRRLAKYNKLLSESNTTDTDDSSDYSDQRHVWLGMRDYYRSKLEAASLAAVATTAAGPSSNNSMLNDDGSQSENASNKSEQLGESSSNSAIKAKKMKKKNHRSDSADHRRRESIPEDQTPQLRIPSDSLVASSSSPPSFPSMQQSDSLPVASSGLTETQEKKKDTPNDQLATPNRLKAPALGGRNGRNDVDSSSGRVDDDDAVIVDDDDDDNDKATEDTGGSSSWRDRDWLSLRKRPKHVYRKRRGFNKGADADVVDLTNEVESDPDDGDVEVLQHDKPVVYLKTEHRRKRRKAARLCAQEGSSASNAAAAHTIDLSRNEATPPPTPVDMNDPDILFGMLLDLPKGYQLPLASASDTNTIPKDEDERGPGNILDGEKAARLCQPSGPDLLEAVCMAQESKHPAGREGNNQTGCSRDASLAGGSYGGRWGDAASPNNPSFPSTSGGGGSFGGLASGAGPSGGGGGGPFSQGGQGDLGFGFGAGPSSSSSGNRSGSKSSEKAMHMEKLWVHLDVPPEDIAQCRLRQSVVDLEVPSNFDYDCTNSPPYPSPFAPGAGGPPPGTSSGAGPSSGTSHTDRHSYASSQYGDGGKFESEPRGSRRRSFGYQPGTSINLAGTSLGNNNNNNNSGSNNSSSLDLLPRNNPFRLAQRTRNPGGYLGGSSSASNSPTEVSSDRIGPSTSLSNVASDGQGSSSSSSSSSNSSNVGHNRSEPVPKLHLVRRCKLWESSSTTPSTSGNGGTDMFSRSQSTPIHVSSPLDLTSLPGPSHRRGPFPPPGGLHQDAGSSSSFGGSSGQLIGDPFGSAFGYNPRQHQGVFGRPFLSRIDEDARNAVAVASILPPSSNGPRLPRDRQNSFDITDNNNNGNNNGGRSMSDFFWVPNLHNEEVPSRNANYDAGNSNGVFNDNSRAAAGSSGSNNRQAGGTRNNGNDVQFLAANLPDSLLDDDTDDDVLPGNITIVVGGAPPHTSSRSSARSSNPPPCSRTRTLSGRGNFGSYSRRQPDSFDEPQPSGSSTNSSIQTQEQPSTSSGGGGGGGGDSGNNMEISCPICLDSLTEIKAGPSHLVSTVCGHLFCNGCLEPAVRRTKQCPTCRRKLTKKQYHKVYL